jgi:hypothetical protein
MEWRIESRQKSVAGIGGHNYLVLIAPDGTTRGEIHGTLGSNQRLVLARSVPEPEVSGAAQLVLAGPPDRVNAAWQQMQEHADRLNGKAVYGLLSPNSNAFWATVLRQSGFDHRRHKPNSNLPTPGIDVDLSDPLWWTPEHRWPGATVPDGLRPGQGTPAERLP